MNIRKQTFFSDDDYLLLRKHIFEIAKNICSYLRSDMKVLEIGPSHTLHVEKSSDLDTCIIRDYCKTNGISYKTLDIDTQAKVDYIGSVEDLSFLQEKFDVIIMLSVLEHVQNIFVVPEQLHNIMNKGGMLFINTPFLFKVHGPVPDCWRITEYGYKALFEKLFSIKSITTSPPNELGKNSMPLSFNVTMERL